MRLQTFLAHAGVASRRAAEEVIRSGRVTVNGSVVCEKGFAVDPSKDAVTVGGRRVATEDKRYYVLHKPKGVTSTVRDIHARKTVVELLPGGCGRLYPVGRLDKETTGLILLTNDGELAYRLTHPRYEVGKTYRARVEGEVDDEKLRALEGGVRLDDGKTASCRARTVSRGPKETVIEIEIHEGRKRQVRRMFESRGHRVLDLARTSFGPIALGALEEGAVRSLSAEEVVLLKKAVGGSKMRRRS